ncbi:hypothetical protein VFPFJ_08137 [Purpureocillium lilacinum]|uniref:Uncharacterized protein n=1 Tax=Purpureocillium lilacinum TaxID=33203 RepID=A0A179H7M1_PURLI|nr:hypothetical protein VFPFJ_08137 [Purpureocillium lilacinum]OAQ85748.1 hypothetical protein VFPFJ_08137 [Purpureocillium lilacinum]
MRNGHWQGGGRWHVSTAILSADDGSACLLEVDMIARREPVLQCRSIADAANIGGLQSWLPWLGVDVVTEHRHPAQTPDMGRHALSSRRSSKGPPKGQEPNARSETEIGETDDGVSAISARSRQERNTN